MFSLIVEPTETRLNGITLYEKIDMDMLNAFNSSEFSVYEDKWGTYSYNEQLILTDYAANYKKKLGLVAVDYTRGKKKLGRVNPTKSLGMTAIRRITRNTFMRNTYYDIDMDNCHPVILRGIIAKNLPEGKKIELQFPHLVEYCDNRNKIIGDVMRGYSCDKKRAKNAFISLMYNGSVASWKHGAGVPLQGTDPVIESFLDKFHDEVQKITDLFIAKNPDLYKHHADAYRKDPKNKDKKNERGSFLSTITQDYEMKIIDHLLTYVMLRTNLTRFGDKHILTYSYDGFMLLKERVDANGGLQALLEDLTQRTFDYCGIEINFSAKNMNADGEYHTEFVYTPQVETIDVRDKKEDMKKKDLMNYNDAFEKMKVEFEKENFKVVQNSCFVQETYDEEHKRKLIQRCTAELNVAFSHLHIKYKGWEDDKQVEKSVPFVPMWIKCENIRRYDRMDCYPDMSKCPVNCFNIWTPFEMERYKDAPLVDNEEVRKGIAFLRNHMSIMCDHEPETLLEFEKWLAQMIQFPDVKSHMPIFQSQEGSGKGSFFTLLRKILGVDKVFETPSPEEYVWGRFNNMMETAFLIIMNEISKQMTNGGIDKIKDIIDSPEITIQHKGRSGYKMKSFHRFAGCTNAWDGGMTISKGSRRFLMCRMSNEKKGDVEYWTHFRSLLEKIDVLRGFYTYYKTMKVERVLPTPVDTMFAKELQKLSVDVPTLWVKDLVADASINRSTYLINNKNEYKKWSNSGVDEYVIELTGKRAWQLLMEWCKDNGFPHYETNPVKLGVFLNNKKWAGLIKGRKTNVGDTRYYRVEKLMEELED
jgi:hypothetical protein